MNFESTETNYRVVEKNAEVVIYEDGYWMKRKDYDFIGANNHLVCLNVDKKTRQITYAFLPNR